ncbi:hypothetical protein BS50DRAFT_574345 [Corynespora cassiicola Philippines]|uniref:Uncharacterized protein n=1 Tax=Corynespora cassiicola Philippines TaxID=1448308 RepID=A0A2T2NKB9_CORCC|nr:hypothetical protein BS50DRAFT_574345 [Corynespora cassiicola Philippines]
MPASSPESSQELDYPPVRVDRSLSSLDLNTLIMRSNPRRPADEQGPSLEDSTYEILGDSVYSVSDDEGHTESLASTDVATPDDVAALSDDDTFDDDEYANDASQHFARYAEPAEDALDAHHVAGPDDSTITETTHMEDSESSRLMRLEEISSDGDEHVVEAWGLVKGFDESHELPAVLQCYGCPDIRLTVRAALSQHFMPATGSFRILYVGSYPDWAEKEISSHIGKALDAPPGSSRYIQVGGQMEQYGPVMDIDHCTALDVHKEAGKPPQVLATLDDGTQFAFGPGRTTKTRGATPLPDLVIFCHPSPSSSFEEIKNLKVARIVLRTQQIPCLDIALTRPFGSYLNVSSYPGSLRLCVEGRQNQKSDYELQEVLPIDHYELVHMDPSQLNRHLAFIRSRYANSRSRTQGWAPSNIIPRFFKEAGLTAAAWLSPLSMMLPVLGLSVIITGYLLMTAHDPLLTNSSADANVESAVSSIYVPRASITSSPLPPMSAAPAMPIISTPRDLTVVPSQEQAPDSRRGRTRDDKLGAFEIQTTGDYQFVLSPSKKLVDGKKKPQLKIQVIRDAQAVPIRYVRTLSGVYIVDLEQEHSVGDFNVSIATHSKPLLRQSFQIQLGHNRSKLAQLISTLKHDVALVQGNLKNISSAVSGGLHEGLSRWRDGSFELDGYYPTIYGRFERVTEKAMEEIGHQLHAGSAYLEQFRGNTWQRLRTATAPVRTSPQLLWMRKHALRARHVLEDKIGGPKEEPVQEPKYKPKYKSGKGRFFKARGG